jgi:3'(2'), 5'-bisphosphate nucleotidase
MVGLVIAQQVVFGWIYAPKLARIYYGGADAGTWYIDGNKDAQQLKSTDALKENTSLRLMMGFRDRKVHPEVINIPGVEFVKAGSVGLKVAKILHNEADIFIHLSGKLKLWDTAAPVAIAMGAGLEIGQLDSDLLRFQVPPLEHCCPVIIGRKGSLAWAREHLKKQ